jgi:hypothetical protein
VARERHEANVSSHGTRFGAFACALGGDDGRTLLITAAPDFSPGLRRAATESVLLTTTVQVPRIGTQD